MIHPLRSLRSLSLVLPCLLLACGESASFDDIKDKTVAEMAKAACEEPNGDLLRAGARMLPGRNCLACHATGGPAEGQTWTAAGTVYSSATSPCNTGGVANAKVEILDFNTGKTLRTMTTNVQGNFYTAEPLNLGSQGNFKARVTSEDGRLKKEMSFPASSGGCASCHFAGGTAASRIYLN